MLKGMELCHRTLPSARQSSTLPMNGMWKRGHVQTIEAPPDERGGNRRVWANTTAPHLDSTFRFYVLNFSNYNKTYGAVGGVIVLLTWMYLSMLVFLKRQTIAWIGSIPSPRSHATHRSFCDERRTREVFATATRCLKGSGVVASRHIG
jgi:hypothetical protein